jgi:hypothetical protein
VYAACYRRTPWDRGSKASARDARCDVAVPCRNKMPGVQAHQCRALRCRASAQARADGSAEDARQKARGTYPGCWSGGIAPAPGLSARTAQGHGYPGGSPGWNRPKGVELTLFGNCGAQTIAKLVVVDCEVFAATSAEVPIPRIRDWSSRLPTACTKPAKIVSPLLCWQQCQHASEYRAM